MNSDSAECTVIITTNNRKDDLRKAVASAQAQDAGPHVLVIDDGSTDGTSEMIRSEFPGVRLERSEQSLGLIVQRNRAAALASTPFVVSIDDDAVFSTSRIVSQTIAEFDDPRIGAVAIPFIDVKQGNIVKLPAPDRSVTYVTVSYIGTAHALRRELFLKLGGYREFLVHEGEEDDFCIRMLAAGHVVRMGLADPIHHFESPKRDFRRWDIFARRNNVLFIWCNVPLIYLPTRMAGTFFNAARRALQAGRFLHLFQGLMLGYLHIPRYWRQRQPVPIACYRYNRMLLRHGPLELSQVVFNWLPRGDGLIQPQKPSSR
jgi:glycosyltransferase involved in cell wall biosynthesis